MINVFPNEKFEKGLKYEFNLYNSNQWTRLIPNSYLEETIEVQVTIVV